MKGNITKSVYRKVIEAIQSQTGATNWAKEIKGVYGLKIYKKKNKKEDFSGTCSLNCLQYNAMMILHRMTGTRCPAALHLPWKTPAPKQVSGR